MNRYYSSRSRLSGKHIIFDRELKLSIAECRYKEQADLVVRALNFDEASQVEAKQAQVKDNVINTKSQSTHNSGIQPDPVCVHGYTDNECIIDSCIFAARG